ncbi:hypothetical protein GJ744_000235 [Endocarpon pusillum]|uniref:Uncharacterized protein n=1 Tax=Endocarpon pusillum TaxID=364733 RepID=A0A8H7EAC8_9EURO|nr:hypothetical protein GJ744_000235 [Endocarpon pusillum]
MPEAWFNVRIFGTIDQRSRIEDYPRNSEDQLMQAAVYGVIRQGLAWIVTKDTKRKYSVVEDSSMSSMTRVLSNSMPSDRTCCD